MPHGVFGSSSLGTSFSAAPFLSVQDLISSVMTATLQSDQDVNERARILEFVNTRYLQILKGRHWKFMERQLIYDINAPFSTGTVSINQGSRTLTGSGTNWSASYLDWKAAIGSFDGYHRVYAINSTTEIETIAKWTESNQSAVTYELFNDRIQAPQDIQAIRSVYLNGNRQLKPLGVREFRLMEEKNPILSGVPQYFTLVEMQGDGGAQWRMQLYPCPDQKYTLYIDYTARPTLLEDDEDQMPMIPDYHRDVLYYAVLSDVYAAIGDQQNAALKYQDYQRSYLKMCADKEVTDSNVIIQPDRNYYRNANRRHKGYYGLRWFGKVD